MNGKTVTKKITRGVLAAVMLLALLLAGWPAGTVQAAPGDPWLTFAGSQNSEFGYSVAVDGSGNTYITGPCSCDWGNPIVPYSGEGQDVFVAKFSSSGALVWNTFFGTEGIKIFTSRDITLDGSGNVYVVGDFPGYWGSEGYIYKFTNDGSLMTSIKLGASDGEVGRYGTHVYSIKVSGENIYVAGSGLYTWEGDPPVRGLSNFPNSNDAFVAKFNTSLVRQWYTFLGGNTGDAANSLVLDGSGNIYVAGLSEGAWSAVDAPTVPRRPYFDGADGFAAKLDTYGNLDWHTFFRNEGNALALDAAGNLYITGDYLGVDWGETDPLRVFSGGRDAFVVKLAATGAYLWHTFLGAPNWDRGFGIAVSGTNVYVTGESTEYYPDWSNAGTTMRSHSGAIDAFVVNLDTDGNIQWHAFYGGDYDDSGQVIRVLGGYIYVAGYSGNTWGVPVRDYSSGTDAFIVKLTSNGQLEPPANLTSLTENLAGDFNPAFTGGTYEYALSATPGEDSVTMNAVLADADVKYSYTGVANKTVASGTDEVIPLAFGTNGITINVTKAGCAATTYTITVTRNSDIATVTSAVYTVSTGVTANETIVNVPFGTTKANFLANLAKGQANQTWNDAGIHDPVVSDDTLVVTAQDGTTTVTYTVTVNAASNDTSVTSGTYTVNAGNSTITGVPFQTAKATFLAAIAKGQPDQVWNTDNIADPVVTGNTLVVTAQDGTTVVTYTVTVNAASTVATVTSAVYTVSAGGTAAETIVNVPFGTAKAAFLANLAKGQANQTWNDAGIHDPVLSDDTLVVTAQDGTTIVTYTITVNAASNDASVTSGTYTVNAGNSTITGVPFGKAKATFLAAIAKGQPDQVWNTDNIADPVVTGNTLVVTAQDGTTIVTYTITVNAAPNNGGGGGGGGGGFAPQPTATPDPEPEPPAGTTNVSASVNSEGAFTAAVNIVAEDADVAVDIPVGTVGLDANLQPLAEITMVPLAEPPAPVPGGTVAFMYDLGPDGATFEPAITLSMPLPEGADPATATIAYWDGSEWIILETTYDPETGRLTAQTTHFTVFGTLVLEPEPVVTPEPEKPVEPVPTASPAPVTETAKPAPAVTTTSPAPPVEETPVVIEEVSEGIAWYWWLIVGIGAVVIIATALIELRQRRQS